MAEERVTVVGAGLAGCEAAWQLLKQGIRVRLMEMKPARRSPAHHSDHFAELVCSNSLRSDRLQNAAGLLKAEMRLLDSLVMRAADRTRVPAGGTLAVDREAFGRLITQTLLEQSGLERVCEEVVEIPEGPVILATGPLTGERLCGAIAGLVGRDFLHFFDAAAPIVTRDSLDMERIFRASRYGRGEDYLNCPMDEGQYNAFVDALLSARTAQVRGFESEQLFEGCLPVESIARRGRMSLAFGPMKPVGLADPATGREPFAVVQLRRDDAADTLYNLVGFQTRLAHPEQKRVFSMIPGLQNAEFARFGVMHRNAFLNSPGLLNRHYALAGQERIAFAGQITGVEGYVESAASGLLCALGMAARLQRRRPPDFPGTTAIGALARYVSSPNRNFQPMNINFGLMDPLERRVRGREQRYLEISRRALETLAGLAGNRGEPRESREEDSPCN